MKEFRNTLSGYSSTEMAYSEIKELKKAHVNMWNKADICAVHFHAVFKTWPTFQELMSIVSFRRRRWSQSNFSENRNIQGNQSKDILSKIRGLRRNIVLASRRCRWRPRLLFSGRPTVPFININTDLMSTKIYVLFCAYESIGVLKALILATENELIKTKIKFTLFVEKFR